MGTTVIMQVILFAPMCMDMIVAVVVVVVVVVSAIVAMIVRLNRPMIVGMAKVGVIVAGVSMPRPGVVLRLV